ncbi:MAG: hypothetical protein ACYSWW_17115 [Planctomycetota bacterium]
MLTENGKEQNLMLVEHFAKLGSPARNATSASLIVIAALAMYKWTVTPQTAYLSAARGYESAIEKVVEQSETIAQKVGIKKKELQALRENSAQLQSVLFTPDEAKEFFSDLQVISEQAGCAVQSVNLLADRQEPENERLGVATSSAALSVVGVYKDIARLLARLQARTEKVWIGSIELRILDPSSDKARCDLTVIICHNMDKDT